MINKIEIRCKRKNCNRLFMRYYVKGEDICLNLEGLEIKCEKCKRVLRFCNYTENTLLNESENGVFRI